MPREFEWKTAWKSCWWRGKASGASSRWEIAQESCWTYEWEITAECMTEILLERARDWSRELLMTRRLGKASDASSIPAWKECRLNIKNIYIDGIRHSFKHRLTAVSIYFSCLVKAYVKKYYKNYFAIFINIMIILFPNLL